MITVDGNHLSIESIWRVAVHGESVRLAEEAKRRVLRSSQIVSEIVAREGTAYGITTGFGTFRDKRISREHAEELQRNLLMSHAVGVGDPLPEHVVRATLLIRLNALAKGLSGVRTETLQMLCELLNRRVHPVIPSKGSVGASGDLAPLAHMGLVVIGMGEAIYNGERVPGRIALERAGLSAIKLGSKEGLALINGSNLMTAIGALAVRRAENLLEVADAVGAMTVEALGGSLQAFDPRMQAARPHPGQAVAAANIARFLEGSQLLDVGCRVQDAYSLRCMPQVHGAIRDTIKYARGVIEIESNSATDNPLLFYDDNGQADIVSGGNFHGEPVALAMDFLGIALAELASISERRTARLIDDKANNGLLPPSLIQEHGLNTGFMVAQYTAAALVSENKVLAHPASVDSIPTSLGFEDHVSMGTIAARKAMDILENTETVLGIELLAGCQAIDLRLRASGADTSALSKGTRIIHGAARKEIPFLECDTVLYPLIEAARRIVTNEAVVKALIQGGER